MRSRAVLGLSGLFVVACSSSGPARGPEASSNEIHALTWKSCGPTDGPATTIVLGEGELACGSLDSSKRAHEELEIWSMPPSDGAPIALSGSTGMARRCDARGECRPIENATVTFGEAGSGEVRFTEGGVTTVRTFHAVHCQVRMMCG